MLLIYARKSLFPRNRSRRWRWECVRREERCEQFITRVAGINRGLGWKYTRLLIFSLCCHTLSSTSTSYPWILTPHLTFTFRLTRDLFAIVTRRDWVYFLLCTGRLYCFYVCVLCLGRTAKHWDLFCLTTNLRVSSSSNICYLLSLIAW